MSDEPANVTEAKKLVVFFGKKYQGLTLGEVCKIREEHNHPRGLLWIAWVANLNAVNGPQPRAQRIEFHRACQLLAEHYEKDISAGIEEIDANLRRMGAAGERKHYKKIKPPEVYEV